MAVGGPTPHERHAATLTMLRETPAVFDLPDRLSLFGHTRLACTDVQLLDALATHHDLHLWLTKVRALGGAWGSQAAHRARVMAAIADGSLAWS